MPKLFRHHKINMSYLWPLQLQEVLKVSAIDFLTFMSMANYCLDIGQQLLPQHLLM